MARRVNKRFLTILTLVIMGCLIGLWALQRTLASGNMKNKWARGDKLFQEGSYQEAKLEYGSALRTQPNSVEGWVKYGDTMHELVRYDLEEMGNDVKSWERALEINATYVPAL